MATDFRKPFWEGRRAEADDECPYILTSNFADAWMLGWFAKLNGIDIEKKGDLVKSRGYTWKLRGDLYSVDGRKIKKLV
jgi:hypothetical protein